MKNIFGKKEDVKSLTIPNFSRGIVVDTDATEVEQYQNNYNSLQDCLNVEIDTIKGCVVKRNGFTDNTKYNDVPKVTDYILVDMFEFEGGDGNLISIAVYKDLELNRYKLYYKKNSWLHLSQQIMDDNTIVTESYIPEYYELNDKEKPCFDVFEGICRIGLGKNYDPLMLFYNKDSKFFRYRTYEEVEEQKDIDTIYNSTPRSYLSVKKGWFVKRALPDIKNYKDFGIDVIGSNNFVSGAGGTVEIQLDEATYPYWYFGILDRELWAIFRLHLDNSNYSVTLELPLWSNNMGMNRTVPARVTFALNSTTHSWDSQNGTLTVGVQGWDNYELGDEQSLSLSARPFAKFVLEKISEALNLETITLPLLSNKKFNEVFEISMDCGHLDLQIRGIAYTQYYDKVYPYILIKMVNFGDSQSIDKNPVEVAKYYVPAKSDYLDCLKDTLESLPGFGSIYFYFVVGVCDVRHMTSQPGMAGIINPSKSMHKGLYHIALTMMSFNEETIPFVRSTVNVTNTATKLAFRIVVDTTKFKDYRIKAIKVYVKRIIPLTDDMTPTERNEAAKYTDNDYRHVGTIDFLKHDQLLRDILRKNTGDVLGVEPAIWKTYNNLYYMDYLVTDLISDTGLEQSSNQDQFLGYLAQNLDRSEYDEGIVRYSGAIVQTNRRFIFGIKKKPDIRIDEYEEFNDKIYYSLISPNGWQFDVFAQSDYITIGDGSPIQKLVKWRNKVIVMTTDSMAMMDVLTTENAVEDVSVLDVFSGSGTTYPDSVIATDKYILWCNDFSAWIWSGEVPINIMQHKIQSIYKNMDIVNIKAGIVYGKEYYMLLIEKLNGSNDLYVFSVNANAWTKFMVANNTMITGFFNDTNSKFYMIRNDATGQPYVGTYPTKYYYDYLGELAGAAPFISYIITNRLHDEEGLEKDYQSITVSYESFNKLYIKFFNLFSSSLLSIIGTATLPPGTSQKPYGEYTLPCPLIGHQGLKLFISDADSFPFGENIETFKIKFITIKYTELEEPFKL